MVDRRGRPRPRARVPQPLAWRVASAALIFVVSDALIAMTAFGPLPVGRLVSARSATYVAAPGMIVTGSAHGVLARIAAHVARATR